MTENLKHDQLFKKAMENPMVAKDFLNTHLPDHIKSIIDLSTIKIEKETFIEKSLQNSACDVLFSVKFNNNKGYIYTLIEHVRHEVARIKSAVMQRGCI